MAGKAARFVGPGAMVSVSYIDPGNYSTKSVPFKEPIPTLPESQMNLTFHRIIV